MIDWFDRGVPAAVGVALSCLQHGGRHTDAAKRLTPREWEHLLRFCDEQHLTLYVARALGNAAPAWVRDRTASDLEKNSKLHERRLAGYERIQSTLSRAGVDFVLLKGFAHWPDFCPDPRLRRQMDFDLWVDPGQVAVARQALLNEGWIEQTDLAEYPADHAPSLIEFADYEWKGDWFDPSLPLAVELHYRLWDEATERIRCPEIERSWERRQEREIEGRQALCLDPRDGLNYACLHALRHLLRGSLRAAHLFEVAQFLRRRGESAEFWREWESITDPGVRRLAATAGELAAAWFGCPAIPGSRGEIEWVERFGAAPIEALFRPNKHELWLHLSLLEDASDRRGVLWRRLFPTRVGHGVSAGGGRRRWLLQRARHHAGSLATLPVGAAWYFRNQRAAA